MALILLLNRILILFILLDFSLELNEPDLKQLTSSNDMMTLQCTVLNYDQRSKVHFHCKFVNAREKDDRCYEECSSIRDKLPLISCTKHVNGSQFTIEYVVNKSIMPTGSYHCRYKNLVSHSIYHVNENKVDTTTGALVSTKSIVPTSPKPITVKSEIIISLLSVLAFSIILNILFFIRCLVMRNFIQKPSTAHTSPVKRSLSTCLCIERSRNPALYSEKTRDNTYDNIRDLPPDFDTTKSKSSSGHESQHFLVTPTSSQLTKSSTFPYRQSILVQTPTDQIALSSIQPYMMPFIIENGQYVMGSVLNHRQSSHGIYDDVAADAATTMPIRQFASTGSLNHRPKRFVSSQSKASPLPEEIQHANAFFTNRRLTTEEGCGFITNDVSSIYDANSSEEAYISGRESDSLKDPVRTAKLEMSREMMAKADTLLREAHNLLK